jgi:hypothetical protein
MNRLIKYSIVLVVAVGCENDEIKRPDWTEKASLPDTALRSSPVGFALGSSLYYGLGSTVVDFTTIHFSDWYVFNTNSNTWKKLKDFPSTPPSLGTFISTGSKGYYGLGLYWTGSEYTLCKDIWEYDPTSDSWAVITQFPGTVIRDTGGFSLNDKLYFVSGRTFGSINGNLFSKEVWEYDLKSKIWTRKNDIPLPGINQDGYQCKGAASEQYGYILFGGHRGRLTIWKYDQILDSWTEHFSYYGAAGDLDRKFLFSFDEFLYYGGTDDESMVKYKEVEYPLELEIIPVSQDIPGVFCTFLQTNFKKGYIIYRDGRVWEYDPCVSLFCKVL